MSTLTDEIARSAHLCDHPRIRTAGKTTLTEKLLLFGGAIPDGGRGQGGARRPAGGRARTGWRSSASRGIFGLLGGDEL